jgi:hypothetical protein
VAGEQHRDAGLPRQGMAPQGEEDGGDTQQQGEQPLAPLEAERQDGGDQEHRRQPLNHAADRPKPSSTGGQTSRTPNRRSPACPGGGARPGGRKGLAPRRRPR